MRRLSHLPTLKLHVSAAIITFSHSFMCPSPRVCVCLQMIIKVLRKNNTKRLLNIFVVVSLPCLFSLPPVAAEPGHTQTGGSGLRCQACTVWGITRSPPVSSHLQLLLQPGEGRKTHFTIACFQSAHCPFICTFSLPVLVLNLCEVFFTLSQGSTSSLSVGGRRAV